ncbi:hypothetical protein [Clavibacter tessellarius]|uniref:hypothetical protein n=1 Tax=Clavibacter tessellarius TaxID=31965 RepID=UPI0032436C6A
MTGPETTGDPAEGADRRDRTARAGRADRGDRPRRPLWKRKRLWIPVGVVVLAVVAVGVSAALILPRVDTVQSEPPRRPAALRPGAGVALAGDVDAAKSGAAGLREHTAAAADAADDGVLAAYEWVPAVGPNLHAARVLASATDRLATDVVTPATEVSLSAFTPVLGRIDLDGIRSSARPSTPPPGASPAPAPRSTPSTGTPSGPRSGTTST